jgi:DNA polymerase II small subunit/DNA polymerase delta subunit B
MEKKIGGMRVKKPKLEEENRVIDGVVYITPPPSPRRSDEYVPEYDLLDSPYDMCIGETTDERLKLIEKYSGPKSLVEKIRKKPESCNCTDMKKDSLHYKNDIEEARRKLIESKSPEERWKVALKDAALMDHFIRCKDNAPCWTPCKKFARSIRLVRKNN